jgi:hypothetical protein
MAENGERQGHLTTPQRKALLALSNGSTRDQAAVVANRSRRTIDRWLQDEPAFSDAMRASTDASIDDAGRRLAALLDLAIEVLIDILGQDDISAHVRLRAVEVAIGHMVKLRDHGELSDRVTSLEKML